MKPEMGLVKYRFIPEESSDGSYRISMIIEWKKPLYDSKGELISDLVLYLFPDEIKNLYQGMLKLEADGLLPLKRK